MPKLWNNLSAKLWRAIPEGSRDELLAHAQGYVTQRGAFAICSADRMALLSLEQDYGKLIESYARELGFVGPVTYVLSAPVETLVEEDVDDVREPVDARTQLSLFDAPERPIYAQRQEKRATTAALRASEPADRLVSVGMDTGFLPPQTHQDVFDLPALRPPESAPSVDIEQAAEEAGIHPRRDLTTWIRGEENIFAHGAAKAVAEGDIGFGGMLFVHGVAGMGKTHLLQAIGLEALRRKSTLRVRYMRAETFVNAFIEALRNKEMEAFRRRMRVNIDLLLLDDIEFLSGKENCQEELLHALNDLLHAQKLVVMTSSVARDELQRFDARLRNRLASGLSVSIDAPATASRRTILENAAEEQGIHAPAEVLDYVAHTVRCNTREFLSHFSRVLSYARFTRRPLTLEIARKQLENSYKQASRKVSMTEIVEATVEHYELRPKDIVGRGRTKRVVTPRKLAMFLGRELTEMSYPELGRFFDNRDHTTVLDAYRSIKTQLTHDAQLRDQLASIQRALGVD